MGCAMRKLKQSPMSAVAEKRILGNVRDASLKRWYVKWDLHEMKDRAQFIGPLQNGVAPPVFLPLCLFFCLPVASIDTDIASYLIFASFLSLPQGGMNSGPPSTEIAVDSTAWCSGPTSLYP